MSKSLRFWSSLAAIPTLVTFAYGFYVVNGTVSAGTQLRPEDEDLSRLGAAIYAQNCASCHGAGLEGENDWQSGNADGSLRAPSHDETGHTWHHADELLFWITKFGTAQGAGIEGFQSSMPAFEDSLSDREIIAVLSWIKAQWPDEIRERHDMLNEQVRNSNR